MLNKYLIILIIIFFIFTLSQGKDWGYSPGQMVITIERDYLVNLAVNDQGFLTTGLADVDRLNREYGAVRYRYTVGQTLAFKPGWERFRNSFIFFFTDKNLEIEYISQMYGQLPSVRDAHPAWIKPIYTTPDDPIFYNQWHLRKIKADSTWNLTTGSDLIIMSTLEGVDWKHRDLAPVIWQNCYGGFGGYGEDADRDGYTLEYLDGEWQFDPGDLNGIDDDLNGWVDDLIGYDFIDSVSNAFNNGVFAEDSIDMDNDPGDFILDGHGTHTSGTMLAATNNAFGVAGVNWQGKLMILRSDYYKYDPEDHEATGVSDPAATYLAMGYAIDKGCNILSFSWGSGRIDVEMRDLVEYAWEVGLIMTGAAGNDDVVDISYPGNYHDVITVAATDINDRKTGFSNFGAWIEISSPGEGIWSTTPLNSFMFKNGTSMSTPIVAGVAALMLSAFPDSSNQWIRDRMLATTDTIEHLNPGYRGMLGSGRVNALRAIGPIRYPWLTVEHYSVTDSSFGNRNGRVDPGEEAEVFFQLGNRPLWQPATTVNLEIFSDDPEIFITDSCTVIPLIEPGNSESNRESPLRFIMNDPSYAHYTEIRYRISSNEGFSNSGKFSFLIGRPAILVLDADGDDGWEDYYLNPLEEARLIYDHWDRYERGIINSYEMNLYETIILFTGNLSEGTVTPGEQEQLTGFLEAGGNLLITGQYIGDDIGETPFFREMLRGEHTDDLLPTLWGFGILGISGNPVSDGLELSTLSGSGNQVSLSGVTPLEGASGIFRYNLDDSLTRFAAISYESPTYHYKAVYLGFGLEGIGNFGDPASTVLNKTLEWFGYYPGYSDGFAQLPRKSSLFNYPNPFNNITTLSYHIDRAGMVSLKLYDINGKLIEVLVNSYQNAGSYSMKFDATSLSSGIYFSCLDTPELRQNCKLILLK
ncbi:S8 family peptidase [bacterium]|nr:S8 family peptidase [bacterium]